MHKNINVFVGLVTGALLTFIFHFSGGASSANSLAMAGCRVTRATITSTHLDPCPSILKEETREIKFSDSSLQEAFPHGTGACYTDVDGTHPAKFKDSSEERKLHAKKQHRVLLDMLRARLETALTRTAKL